MHPVQWIVFNALNLYLWVIIIGAVLSWLVAFDVVNTRNQLVSTILDVTDRLTAPVLRPIQKVIPPVGGMDLSPIAIFFGVEFLQNFLVPIIPF